MKKRTVRSGLRLLTLSFILLLLGTFYGQQINNFFAVAGDGAAEFVKLAFFWGTVLGAAAILMIIFGLMQRSLQGDTSRLMPSMIFFLLLLMLFFTLFYRSVSSPPQPKQLRPGETLTI